MTAKMFSKVPELELNITLDKFMGFNWQLPSFSDYKNLTALYLSDSSTNLYKTQI